MTTVSRAHVRQGALAKARRLDAARTSCGDLTDDECEIIYIELESRLAERAGVNRPSKELTKAGSDRRHCKACGGTGHDRRTCTASQTAHPETKPDKPRWTDTIEQILRDNPRGLRSYEIAAETKQTTPNVFGILQLLLRTGHVERHGERYRTLWTLPGGTPEPRIETIPAAIVHVLSEAGGPVDARVLHEQTSKIIYQAIGKRPKDVSVRTELARLITKRVVERRGANENGPLFVLADEKGGPGGAPTLN